MADYGAWQGMQHALPNGIQMATQLQQMQVQKKQQALTEMQLKKARQQMEFEDQTVRLDTFMAKLGIDEETSPNRAKLIRDTYASTPGGKEEMRMGDILEMNKRFETDPNMKRARMDAEYKDYEISHKKLIEEQKKIREKSIAANKDPRKMISFRLLQRDLNSPTGLWMH